VLGGIVWATLYGTLGYLFGENLPLLEKWIKGVGLGVTIAVVLALVYLLYLRKKRKKRRELESEASANKSMSVLEDSTDDSSNQ
jgi:membrane protein DedA with SNARE-associated domain